MQGYVMRWDNERIIKRLKSLHKTGRPMAYSKLAKREQSLLSAATYHFGSYRKALTAAGLEYREILQRPRWTRARIIAQIKQARRAGTDLHWSAVTRRGDELSRAAFAALQERLFGSWVRALHAAGLDADDIARYRNWNRNTVAFELRSRAQDGDSLSSGALQKDDPGLHAAAIRYFENYDAALRAAKLEPADHRLRRSWNKRDIVAALKKCHRDGMRISDTQIRRNNGALYGAAVRLFGSFTAARQAAGLRLKAGAKKSKA